MAHEPLPSTPPNPPGLLGTADVARLMDLTVRYVRRMARNAAKGHANRLTQSFKLYRGEGRDWFFEPKVKPKPRKDGPVPNHSPV